MERKTWPGIYSVKITVMSMQGGCHVGLKVGDSWIIDKDDMMVPAGLCVPAWACIEAEAYALRYGAVFPWEEDPDTMHATCNDPGNAVLFELRRLRE